MREVVIGQEEIITILVDALTQQGRLDARLAGQEGVAVTWGLEWNGIVADVRFKVRPIEEIRRINAKQCR